MPAGSQNRLGFTLRGKGRPSLSRGGRGDLHVRLQVWTPKQLTDEQEELFRQLRELEGEPPEDESSGRLFWSRMKEAFGG